MTPKCERASKKLTPHMKKRNQNMRLTALGTLPKAYTETASANTNRWTSRA